ncbi:MAG: hypothetical protein ABI862_11005 [Ilumatobacteraceae bacterium]
MKSATAPQDSAADIIEIIDDGIDPFENRTASTTVHDTGGPRWVGPVAAAALLALIGYGVATSASANGVPKVAPRPSTSTPSTGSPTTIQPTPTTTVPAPAVPYYAADPPRPFVVQHAEIQDEGSDRFDRGSYQLWAAPHSTANSGSWFSIDSLRTGPRATYLSNAYRIPAGEQSFAISHTASGQSIAQFSIDSVMSITLTSFGWADEDLVQLAQSITIKDSTEGNDVALTVSPLTVDHQMISSVQPTLAMRGLPIESVYYVAGGDLNRYFSIDVAPRGRSDEGGSTLVRQIALRYALDHSTPFSVDGHVAIAGGIIGRPEQSMATWIARDHIVTVTAQMPVQQLIDIAQTVHQVSPDEWAGMRFQATTNVNLSSDDYATTDAIPVSFGVDANGEQWNVSVGMSSFSNRQQVEFQWGDAGYGALTEATARISTVVSDLRTYVLAELPRAVAPSGRLQITRDGRDPVVVQFVDTDPSLDRTFAAYAFSEPTPYTAQIVDPNGAVLVSWPALAS